MYEVPLVSIVTVTYNAAPYIEKTLESICSQGYKNIELIIIDGGSSDGTLEIIKKYKDDIAFYLSEADEGVYDAMNKGIDNANGKWINFMNAGDEFTLSSSVSMMIEKLQPETDIAIGGINTMDVNYKHLQRKEFEGIDNIWKYNPCYHQATFVKLKLMQKYKFDLHYKILSDYNFMFQVYIAGCTFQAIDFPVANYLIGGLSEQNLTQVAVEGMSILSKYLENSEDIYNSRWYGLLQNANNFNISSQLFQKYLKEVEELKQKYKKIALYGYGEAGKKIASILGIQVEVIIDKYSDDSCVVRPEGLKGFEYDAVVITVIGREEEIRNFLISELNVDSNKIITCMCR